MEQRTEVKTYLVQLMCDKCGAEMRPSNIVLDSHPPKYPHKCPRCDYTVTVSGRAYPHYETSAKAG